MDIWPSFKWLKVLSQPWEGDVTMVLPSSFMQIAKAITNPSLDDLKGACLLVRPSCCASHPTNLAAKGLPAEWRRMVPCRAAHTCPSLAACGPAPCTHGTPGRTALACLGIQPLTQGGQGPSARPARSARSHTARHRASV